MNQKKRAQIQAKLRSQINGCRNCLPWEGGDVVWLGPSESLYELLKSLSVSNSDTKPALKGFSCPNCSTLLEDDFDDVELKSSYDKQVERVFDKINNKALKTQLLKFSCFLSKYPYLGISQSTGKTIFKSIKQGRNKPTLQKDWFRARLLDHQSRLFKSDEMHAPNPHKIFVKEGRFNHTGQSFLYLSEYQQIACNEIKLVEDNICIIQKYEISNINRKILDLRCDYQDVDPDDELICLAIVFNGLVSKLQNKQSSWKPEYFVPRFVADSARFHGFDGILYTSVTGNGDNLVIFNPNDDSTTPIGKPLIFNEKENDFTNIF